MSRRLHTRLLLIVSSGEKEEMGVVDNGGVFHFLFYIFWHNL